MANEKNNSSLPQAKVDKLLSGINEGNAADIMKQMRQEAEQSAGMQSSFQDEIDKMLENVDVAPDDFYSDDYPHKCTKEQLSAIYKIHEKFASCAVNSLSAFYGKQVSVFLASIDQLTMGDFIRTLPNPTSIGIINMEPLKGSAIIEIGYPMDISSLSPAIFESLRLTWSRINNLQPKLEKAISNPEAIDIVPKTEGVIVITIEVKFGTTETMMNFAIPWSVINQRNMQTILHCL